MEKFSRKTYQLIYTRWYVIFVSAKSAESSDGSFSFWRWGRRWWLIGMSHNCRRGSTGQGYHRSISLVLVRLWRILLDIHLLGLVMMIHSNIRLSWAPSSYLHCHRVDRLMRSIWLKTVQCCWVSQLIICLLNRLSKWIGLNSIWKNHWNKRRLIVIWGVGCCPRGTGWGCWLNWWWWCSGSSVKWTMFIITCTAISMCSRFIFNSLLDMDGDLKSLGLR